MKQDFKKVNKIFEIEQSSEFEALCMEAFQFQVLYNPVYRRFCELIGITIKSRVNQVHQIPFLPVELFRTHKVIIENFEPEFIFKSSGTTGDLQSSHFVGDLTLYDQSLLRGFMRQYGKPSGYCFLALLPSYLERSDSSLVYMLQKLMQHSGHPDNGFYLYDHETLAKSIEKLIAAAQPTILIGVSYALLDFSAKYPFSLPGNFLVMETGGMKGRGMELVRQELHQLLCSRFGVDSIHSEYGMTELLSQAYARQNGIYSCPPWMRVEIRDMNDPFQFTGFNKTGGINVIDLANIYSCPFIETQDLGRKHENGTFEVLGRFDHSQIRGCNIMMS